MDERKIPGWVKIVIIAGALPVLLFPTLLGKAEGGDVNNTLLWCYPIFVIVAAICAWKAYAQRPELSWIVIAMLYLCDIAIWLL